MDGRRETEDAEMGVKRRKKMEESRSEIRRATDEVSSMVKPKSFVPKFIHDESEGLPEGDHPPAAADIPTRPFLSLCKLILQVLGELVLWLFTKTHKKIYR